MAIRDTLGACGIRFIEDALAKLERDLERAEGSQKEAVQVVQEWLADVQHTLRAIGERTLH
jgi:hypothetical protein